MSKGPGRVARAIVAALEAAPTNALTTQELCERCYEPPITKKHRVAVLRALKQVMARRDDIATMASEGLGSQMVTYWRYDITSYAMAGVQPFWHVVAIIWPRVPPDVELRGAALLALSR